MGANSSREYLISHSSRGIISKQGKAAPTSNGNYEGEETEKWKEIDLQQKRRSDKDQNNYSKTKNHKR